MKLNLMDLKNENKRKFISRITEIYIDEVFKGNEEKEKERIYGKILKFSAKVAIGKSIKLSVSAIIAEAIYLNLIKKNYSEKCSQTIYKWIVKYRPILRILRESINISK
ncbi:hypothetical protein C6H68_13415 [Photorhabdus luminescens]|nr:hypothetical protein C6H68_13415 [Photorhabdus luminescens]